jgi:tripartite-type tricarboxylate transporter receptor subunit TctC
MTISICMHRARWLLCALALGAASPSLVAQAYPSKTVRVVVPFAAGGGTDIIARLVGQKLGDSLGQRFLIDNRAGANGIIGTEIVAKSAPDGYTIVLGTTATHAINGSVYAKLPYDPVKDFAPVTNLAYSPFIISVHPSIPVRNIGELIALAKQRPGQISYASAGTGNSTHLAGELFSMLAGVRLVHVPYKGSGPAMADTLGGQTAAIFDSMQASMPHITVKRLRPLALTATARSPVIPDLPTVSEAGVPGAEAGSWYGMFAPAATPKPVVAKLNAEIIKALALKDVRERFALVGVDPIGNTPEQFAAELQSEILKWGKTARIANVRAE